MSNHDKRGRAISNKIPVRNKLINEGVHSSALMPKSMGFSKWNPGF